MVIVVPRLRLCHTRRRKLFLNAAAAAIEQANRASGTVGTSVFRMPTMSTGPGPSGPIGGPHQSPKTAELTSE